MGIIFEPFSADCCCLCGSRDSLTGEHKVKAAALRSLFGGESMAIGTLEPGQPLRIAQGPKSREFHFNARLCTDCNSSRTQAADREFDRFNEAAWKIFDNATDPAVVFELERYAVGSEAYLNVFRYLAKLMCCHLAESGGPRPVQISQFAIGNGNTNNILLHIDRDPTYDDYVTLSGDYGYAAHGGLMVMSDKVTGLPTSFRTSLSLGPVRYLFWVKFGLSVALALQLFHRPFVDKCRAAYRLALEQIPFSTHRSRRRRSSWRTLVG